MRKVLVTRNQTPRHSLLEDVDGWARDLYQFATIHTVNYEFLIKPEESAKCHQTLSSQVGSENKTNALLSQAMHC